MNINKNTYKVETPKSAYTIGLLWADGYLEPVNHTLKLTICEDDASQIRDTISDFEEFRSMKKIHKNQPTWKPIIIFHKTRKKEYNILKEHGFYNKSHISHENILKLIPNEFERFFWRGFFDGDGCIHIKKNKLALVNFASSYNQDWSSLESLLDSLNCSYTIRRKTNKKNHSGSIVLIQAKHDIIKLFEYLYPDKSYDFGFKRKFDKFRHFSEYHLDIEKTHNEKEKFVVENVWKMSKAKMSKITGFSPETVKNILDKNNVICPPMGYWGQKKFLN